MRCGEWISNSAALVVRGDRVLPLLLCLGLVFLGQRENLHHGNGFAGASGGI